MVDFTLKRHPTGDGGVIAFVVPPHLHNEVWGPVKEIAKKHNEHYRVRIDPPFQPRTTGPRSQSARFNGHCEDIAQQLNVPKTRVREGLKRMAAKMDGYPTVMSIDGVMEPESESAVSKQEMSALLRRQQFFADANNLWLTEYSEESCSDCHGTGMAEHSDDCALGLGSGACDCSTGDKKCPVCHGKKVVLIAYRSLHGRTREEMKKEAGR